MNQRVCYSCQYPLHRKVKIERNAEICSICKKAKSWGKSRFITEPSDFDERFLKFLDSKKIERK